MGRSIEIIQVPSTLTVNNNEIEKKGPYKWDMAWGNVIVLTIIHIGALYGLYLRLHHSWKHAFFYRTVGVISQFGVTAGAHRLWAHRCYKANTAVQIILATMFSITYQNSIYTWARDHRLHHKHSETDADPHNANRGFFFSHMGWLMVKKHNDVKEKGKYLDMSDLEANPIVMFHHKYYYYLVFFFGLVLPMFLPWWLWGEPLLITFFTGVMWRYVASVHGTWCINSFAHLWGNKPYDKNIGPAENPTAMIFCQGEGFHNYHHTYPFDYKASEFGNDVRNPTAALIDFFAWCGGVTDRKTVSQDAIKHRINRTGDGSYENDDVAYTEHLFNSAPRTLKDNVITTGLYILGMSII